MEHRHIKHLKKHRNILYGLVVFLLIIQISFFVIFSIQYSALQASQTRLEKTFAQSIGELREDTQYKISAITQELTTQRADLQDQITTQKTDFEQRITTLLASQADFSEVIKDSIRGVVSIGTDKSAGTGFIIHSGGYVVTNQHVVDGARFVKVLTYDNKVYDAEVVGSDAMTDVALLKISGIFYHVDLGDSDNITTGEKVIAIGNPLGLSFTVTEGIVSAVHRQGPNGLKSYIQTDVTLNPGNSGGPLINTQGKVIGMNNFKIGNAEGLGFALESNIIRNAITQFANITLSSNA